MTKSRLILFICLVQLMEIHNLSGQSHNMGVSTGLTLSNIICPNSFFGITTFKPGVLFELNYNRKISAIASVGVAANFSQFGYCSQLIFLDTASSDAQSVKERNEYDYLRLPVRIQLEKGRKVTGYTYAGISPGFLISAKTKIPAFENVDKTTISETKDISRFDAGVFVGAGVSFKYHKNYLFSAEISYYRGLKTLTNEHYFGSITDMYNSSLSIITGIAFLLR